MKTIQTLLLITFSIFTSFSQDIITYKNGKTQKVIILTTDKNDITCQDFETKDQFTIARSFLTSIEYQAGKTEPFGVALPKKIKIEPVKTVMPMADTIHYQNGYIYYKGINYNKPRDIRDILLSVPNEEISTLTNAYKSNIDVGRVVAFIGGFAMGWPVGGAIAGRKFDTGLFLGGVAVTGIGFLFGAAANKNLTKAIELHNKVVTDKKISWSPVLYQNEYNQTNVGIALRF